MLRPAGLMPLLFLLLVLPSWLAVGLAEEKPFHTSSLLPQGQAIGNNSLGSACNISMSGSMANATAQAQGLYLVSGMYGDRPYYLRIRPPGARFLFFDPALGWIVSLTLGSADPTHLLAFNAQNEST
eukprot:RCo032479